MTGLRSVALESRALPRAVPEATRFARDDWETPPALFQSYQRLYGFTIDVAANHLNTCCPRYFDREADGLVQSWAGFVVWMHPPHSDPGAWVRKARREAQRGVTIVGLVPADTNTDWWHDDVLRYASIRFLRGQPQFRLARLPITEKTTRRLPVGPFAIVVFKPGHTL